MSLYENTAKKIHQNLVDKFQGEQEIASVEVIAFALKIIHERFFYLYTSTFKNMLDNYTSCETQEDVKEIAGRESHERLLNCDALECVSYPRFMLPKYDWDSLDEEEEEYDELIEQLMECCANELFEMVQPKVIQIMTSKN